MRDPDRAADVVASWLRAQPGVTEVRAGRAAVPAGSGFSSTTLFLELSWCEGAIRHAGQHVLRIAPAAEGLYPEPDFGGQVRLQRLLAEHTDVPVPPVLRQYDGDDLLGAPFYLMPRIPGAVPVDFPSYHREGWIADLHPAARRALWLHGIEMLHRIHRVDPAPLGFVRQRGLAAQLAYYGGHVDHFAPGDRALAEHTSRWLNENRPPDGEPGLVWGDARIGNLVYAGTTPVAVLDWEMAALGPPEIDLAWYLYLDRNLSEGIGAARLPGLPGKAETLAYYGKLSGRPVRDFGYYEIFAGFRFFLITARVGELARAAGKIPAGVEFPLHRNARKLLCSTLRENAALPSVLRAAL